MLRVCKEMPKNYKLKYLFPKNQKEHPMITRFQENYEVDNAHTTRLLNSPVVYMQRLLNET